MSSKPEYITLDADRAGELPAPEYKAIWLNYEAQFRSIWPPGKIKFSDDPVGFRAMPDELQKSLLNVLGFFAGADKLVCDNLEANFIQEIQVPEMQVALRYQAMMEDVHNQVYNLNIKALVPDAKARDEIQRSVKTSNIVKLKAEWAKKWYASGRPLGERLVAAAAVEGVHFSSSFAFIDWLKTQKFTLRGTFDANTEISRDEAQHMRLGALIYGHIRTRLNDAVVRDILQSAVDIEYKFIDEVIPARGYIGMNRDMMKQHVLHCANILAYMLGYKDMFGVTHCPFVFMTKRSLPSKENFFEEEGMQYNMANVGTSEKNTKFTLTADF